MISPQYFNLIAQLFGHCLKPFLLAAVACFIAFAALDTTNLTPLPSLLLWLPTFLVLAGIECLIIAAFLAFFRVLQSTLADNQQAMKFYQIKEWLEVTLFSILLPMPVIIALALLSRLSLA